MMPSSYDTHSASPPAAKEKVIIDCDAGIDDALALLLALNTKLASNIEVIGITCVGGNTTVDNVVENVLRTLKIAQRNVPVYKGSNTGVNPRDLLYESKIHSTDGIGGVSDTMPISKEEVEIVLKRPNAVDWLGRTIMEQATGSITLLTLGPLTNIAFAHRLYPQMHSKLKRLVIMGGCLNAQGNSGLTAEWNFHCDPEGAFAVLEEFTCPITMLTVDVCRLHLFSREWFERTVTGNNSIKASFVHAIFHSNMDQDSAATATSPTQRKGCIPCDWLATACAIVPGVVLETVQHFCTVELNGTWTRGQSVIDWRDRIEGKQKVNIVMKLDMDKLHGIFEQTLL